MSRARLALLLLILFPMVLVSCSVGRAAREAGEGAFDAARGWYATEGEAKVNALVDHAIDSGIKKLGDAAKNQDGELPPWAAGAAGLAVAALSAYSAYQRGHRTGEDKGWKDGTGDSKPPA